MVRTRPRGVDLALSAILSLLALGLAACSDDKALAERDPKFRIQNSYVGRVEGADAFVAVAFAEGGSQVTAFLSDGDAGRIGRAGAGAEWFLGEAAGPEVNLLARSGARLQARVEGEAAKGTITFEGGRTLEFVAEKAEGDKAGLYREEARAGDVDYLLGWIVLNDGKSRGSSYPPYIRCQAVAGLPLPGPLVARICP